MLAVLLVLAVAILSAAGGLCYLAHNAGLLEVLILFRNNKWYGTVLQNVASGARLLDFGSGITGVVGPRFATLTETVRKLLAKELKVVVIEPNGDKFKKAAETMQLAGLRHSIILHNKAITDTSLRQVFTGVTRFNAICFSSPLMSLPEPAAGLRMAASLLKEGGVIYVPQVLYCSPSMISQILSPLFKFLGIAPIEEVKRVVEEADMEVIDDLPAGADTKKPQAARILVLQPTSVLKRSAPSGDSSVRSRKNVESEC